MNELLIHDEIELGEYMFDLASKGDTVTAVVFSLYAEQLLEYFIADPDIAIKSILFDSCDDREFYVTLSKDLIFDITPVWEDDGDISCKYQTTHMIFGHNVDERIALENRHCEQDIIVYYDDVLPCNKDCIENCNFCSYAKFNDDIANNLELIDTLLSKQ